MAEEEKGFMGRMSEEIREMPGEVSRFAQRVPGMIGKLPGRLAGGGKSYLGLEDSGLRKDQEAFGMNPRRAYWSAALADLGSIAAQQPDPGRRFEMNSMQTQHMERQKQMQQMNEYRKQMANAAILNAKKPRGSDWTTDMKNAKSMGLEPGTPEWNEFIRKSAMKPLVSMGSEVSQDFYSDILKSMPEYRAEAIAGQKGLARYTAMETLLPYMGKTGVGKEMMTTFRSSLNQFGMEEYVGFIDAVGTAAGIDFFSGEQGVNELFKALGTRDVIDRAGELYPVSDKDIGLLKEMVASLRINDPEALKVLIERGKQDSQTPIDSYNEYRTYIENAPAEIKAGMPPASMFRLPETPYLNVDGLIPSDRGGMTDTEFNRQMHELFPDDPDYQ